MMPFPFDDPLFRRFFGEEFGEQSRRPQARRAQSLGSGVVVSSDGYILTANHVIEGADEIRVVLADGTTEYSATVVGTDPPTDVAVLKVEASNLPAITMTDSDNLQVGDVVLAIGNPFGLQQTVTMGIVSAVGRGFRGLISGYEDFIQTDAAINRGNSGGALVDAEGRLIGINTAIVSPTGGFIGVGFAVPINMARHVMDRLLAEGRVARGYLGVSIQDITPELAREFRLPDQVGALVGDVQPNTPAAAAGLREGDVIVAFNGKRVADSRQLRLMVSQTAPGTEVTLQALRNGREQTLKATLGELPEDLIAGGMRAPPVERGRAGLEALAGVEIADVDAAVRRQLDIPAAVRGALVTGVDPDSSAHEAGLRRGDVILEINRQPVRSVDDAVKLARGIETERVLLRVWREGASRYVVVEVGGLGSP